MASRPGTSARARKPAISPMSSKPMMKVTIAIS
jgi:hypothetical protein